MLPNNVLSRARSLSLALSLSHTRTHTEWQLGIFISWNCKQIILILSTGCRKKIVEVFVMKQKMTECLQQSQEKHALVGIHA